jgi:acetyl esterase/lipase
MISADDLTAELITCGRELPLDERFCYRAIQTFTYKQTPQKALDLHIHFPHDWRPTDKRPAIVFFFGGGLQDGTPEQFTRQAVHLAGRGMVAVRADYRVMPKHNVTADRCVADAKSAIRWVRAHATELGIDPDRIAASGGSSGGFLAGAAGILPDFDEPDEDQTVSSRPSLMVLFNPAFGVHCRAEPPQTGTDPALDEILRAAAAPDEDLAARLDNATHLAGDVVPMWIWFGTDDPILHFAQPFLERAQALHSPMTLHLTKGADHAFFNDYMRFYRETLASLEAFLEDMGYLDG